MKLSDAQRALLTDLSRGDQWVDTSYKPALTLIGYGFAEAISVRRGLRGLTITESGRRALTEDTSNV